MSRILPSAIVFALFAFVAVAVASSLFFVDASPLENIAVVNHHQRNNINSKRLTVAEREQIYAHAKATNIKKTLRLKQNKNPHQLEDGSTNPIPQPTSQVIMISNFCRGDLYYDTWQSDVQDGGYEVAPSDTIGPTESATFSAVPFPGENGEVMSGTVWYTGDGFGINIAFALAQGEWEVSVSYPTIADIALVGSVSIGNRAFYNIILGRNPYNGTSVC